MTIERYCQQNTNNDSNIVQPSPPREEVLQAAALWVAKLATTTLETPFVKPARIMKVEAWRATAEGKAARAEKARDKYAAKVLAEERRPVRPINVPDSEEKRAKRRAEDTARKAASRAKKRTQLDR